MARATGMVLGHFLDFFAEHGFDSYALSLRGHGKSGGRERLRWTSIAST